MEGFFAYLINERFHSLDLAQEISIKALRIEISQGDPVVGGPTFWDPFE
jgi:hypothetical protein